jgi:hypothetical protein
MTRQSQDALTASAVVALAGGLLPRELPPVVRYLAGAAHIEITASDVGTVCAGALA